MKHILKVIEVEEKYYFIESEKQQELNDKVLKILKDERDCDGSPMIDRDIYHEHKRHEVYWQDKEYNPHRIQMDFTERTMDEVLKDKKKEKKK